MNANHFFWELENYENGPAVAKLLRRYPDALDKLLKMGFIPLSGDVLGCSRENGLALKIEFEMGQGTWTGTSIVAWREPMCEYDWQETFERLDLDVIVSKIERFLMQHYFSGLE